MMNIKVTYIKTHTQTRFYPKSKCAILFVIVHHIFGVDFEIFINIFDLSFCKSQILIFLS